MKKYGHDAFIFLAKHHKTNLALLIICIFFVTACIDLRMTGSKVKSLENETTTAQSTPHEAIFSFYQAMDMSDAERLSLLVDPSDKSSLAFVEVFQDDKGIDIRSETTDIEVDIIEETGDRVRARVYFTQVLYLDNEILSEGENGDVFTLVARDGKWYFIGLADPIPPGWLLDAPTPVPMVTATPNSQHQ